MDGLLEVLVVDDGPDLAVVVGGPERGGHISAGLAGINPGKYLNIHEAVYSMCHYEWQLNPSGA